MFIYDCMNNKEDIMDNDKTKATGSPAAAEEPLVLRPEWEYKPKDVDEAKLSKCVFTWHQDTNEITLHVNGEEYRKFKCKDNLGGSIKFHEGLDKLLGLFRDWKFYDRN